MKNVIELVFCLCGELMRKEPCQEGQINVCWKCACDSEAELERKLLRKRERS